MPMMLAIRTMAVHPTLEPASPFPLSKMYCMPCREPDLVNSAVVILKYSYNYRDFASHRDSVA